MENRVIKFRVPHFNSRDNSFSHFSYWGTIDHLGKPSLDGGHFAAPSQNNSTYKKWHEQFTGLLDRNGKEIYEGDILRTTTKVGECFFDIGCFYGVNGTLISDNDLTEVIGNIHENKDLIPLQ